MYNLAGVLIGKATFLHLFLWHFVRDLRASFFFAFCGRYRQALQALRSALELLFAGIYFQDLRDGGDKGALEKAWERWLKGSVESFRKGLKVAPDDANLKFMKDYLKEK